MMKYESRYHEAYQIFPWGFEVFAATVRDESNETKEELVRMVENGPFWVEAMHLREAQCIEGVFDKGGMSDK
jgi:hypothetical protein